MKNPIRILFLQNKLLHYRIPLYEYLQNQKGYEVCVAFPEGEITEGTNFRQIKLPVRHLNSFVLHQNLYNLCCEFDIVIAMFDIRWLTHLKLALKRQKPFKLIYWGIGVSTEKGYDVVRRFDMLRYMFAYLADAMVFYSAYPIEKYKRVGISSKKLFRAPNTIKTTLPDHYLTERASTPKTRFVFIGSLHGRKNLDELLLSFFFLAQRYPFLTLHIVGDGTMHDTLQALIHENGMGNRVILHGQITDDVALKKIFVSAVACISPGQAGLSVLKSFSFGVPFITSIRAITGGERFIIRDTCNGLLYPATHDTLTSCMQVLLEAPEDAEKMSLAAFNTYWKHNTMADMASGFEEAIDFTLTNSQYA